MYPVVRVANIIVSGQVVIFPVGGGQLPSCRVLSWSCPVVSGQVAMQLPSCHGTLSYKHINSFACMTCIWHIELLFF